MSDADDNAEEISENDNYLIEVLQTCPSIPEHAEDGKKYQEVEQQHSVLDQSLGVTDVDEPGEYPKLFPPVL